MALKWLWCFAQYESVKRTWLGVKWEGHQQAAPAEGNKDELIFQGQQISQQVFT